MLSRVVFILLRHNHILGTFSGVADLLLVDSDPTTTERVTFLFGIFFTNTSLSVHGGWLDVVERRCEIDINVSFDDADGVILIFRFDFQNVYLILFSKNFNRYGIFFMQTCEIPQLVL